MAEQNEHVASEYTAAAGGCDERAQPEGSEEMEEREEERDGDEVPLLDGDATPMDLIGQALEQRCCCGRFSIEAAALIFVGLTVIFDIVVPIALIVLNRDSTDVVSNATFWLFFALLGLLGVLLGRLRRTFAMRLLIAIQYAYTLLLSSLFLLLALIGCFSLTTYFPELVRNRFVHFFGPVDDSVVRLVCIAATLIIPFVHAFHVKRCQIFMQECLRLRITFEPGGELTDGNRLFPPELRWFSYAS